MIIFSSSCLTSDNVEIMMFACSTFQDDQLLFEIVVQYIDVSKSLFSKKLVTNTEPSKDDLLYTYQSKINRALKTVNSRTLTRLFQFPVYE